MLEVVKEKRQQCFAVWGGGDADAAQERGAKNIGTCWVICNMDDINNPGVRARLVARDVRMHNDVPSNKRSVCLTPSRVKRTADSSVFYAPQNEGYKPILFE